MKKTVISLILCCFNLTSFAQDFFQYQNTFSVVRSSQTAFNKFVLLVPCPQSNEYQDVYELDYTSSGNWILGEISENRNQYLELDMYGTELSSVSKNFSVGYSFILRPKNISVNFSLYKNPDGTWKEMPEYDTSSKDYQDNIKQSGNFVVPNNSTIVTISDQLFDACGGNKLAYAEKCYEYVASHYSYKNPNTGLHPLAEILAAGGGDCGNFSSIYISLLRAKGIPARHVVAMGANSAFHVWAEFYIQNFGWVPVDVTYKNSDPFGNYFGKKDYNSDRLVVVQKGVEMEYETSGVGSLTINLLQTYYYWYWYNTYATLNITQNVTAKQVDYSGIRVIESKNGSERARKVLENRSIVIEYGNHEYSTSGFRMK